MELLQSRPIDNNTYKVSFTCTPTHGTVSFTTTFATYTYADMFKHYINEVLSFTGAIVGSPIATVTEWEWDFGDGTRGIGNPATHTFKALVPGQLVHLKVRTSDGWIGYASMNLMLTPTP